MCFKKWWLVKFWSCVSETQVQTIFNVCRGFLKTGRHVVDNNKKLFFLLLYRSETTKGFYHNVYQRNKFIVVVVGF